MSDGFPSQASYKTDQQLSSILQLSALEKILDNQLSALEAVIATLLHMQHKKHKWLWDHLFANLPLLPKSPYHMVRECLGFTDC